MSTRKCTHMSGAVIAACVLSVLAASCSDSSPVKSASRLAMAGEYGKAVSYLEEKIGVGQRDAGYFLAHGLFCTKLPAPRYRDAIADYKEALSRGYEDNGNVLYELAVWSYFIEEYDDAVAYARRAIAVCDDETKTVLYVVIAESQYCSGCYEEALKTYAHIIDDEHITLYVLVDYNKLLSIINGDDSLVCFWDTLERDGVEKESGLIACYGKALIDIGKFKEAEDCFVRLAKAEAPYPLARAYAAFLRFLNTGNDTLAEKELYVDDMESLMAGNAVSPAAIPDLDLLRLSSIYFYLRQDYPRAGAYCAYYETFSKDLQTQKDTMTVKEIESCFAHDRLFRGAVAKDGGGRTYP